jgi:hypothetical protein
MTQQAEDVTVEFTPIENFNASDIPPEAPDGQWTALFSVTKRSATQDKGDGMRFPMLSLDIKLESAEDSENAYAEGTHLKDWLVVYPSGLGGKYTQLERMGKERLDALGKALGFDPASVISGNISTFADLDGLVAAIDGNRASVWTSAKTERSGEKKTRVYYSAPKRRKS